jgi:hypothetical protein
MYSHKIVQKSSKIVSFPTASPARIRCPFLQKVRPRPYKRTRTQESRDPEESILYLTENDRKKAIDLMTDICRSELDDDALEQLQELQRMLMLGIKAEIQAVDDFGDLAKWLDTRLKPA